MSKTAPAWRARLEVAEEEAAARLLGRDQDAPCEQLRGRPMAGEGKILVRRHEHVDPVLIRQRELTDVNAGRNIEPLELDHQGLSKLDEELILTLGEREGQLGDPRPSGGHGRSLRASAPRPRSGLVSRQVLDWTTTV